MKSKWKYFLVQGKWKRKRIGKIKRAYRKEIEEGIDVEVKGRNRYSRNVVSYDEIRLRIRRNLTQFEQMILWLRYQRVMENAEKVPPKPKSPFIDSLFKPETRILSRMPHKTGVVSVPARYPAYMPKAA